MNRGADPVKAVGNDITLYYATYIGGGNTADLTVPADTVARKITNLASTGARTGEGVYDCVLSDCTPEVIVVDPRVEGAGHRAEVTTSFDVATKKVVITTRNAAGTADDLPTTDRLVLIVHGRNSKA